MNTLTEKSTILFIPGMACTSQIWDALELLPHYFNCVYLDWPEHSSTFENLDDCAKWVTEMVKEHDATIVVGHSLGGLGILKAMEKNLIQPEKAIIIESFLNVPNEFFKKFVGPYASDELEKNLHEMFNTNRNHFSEKLRLFLREKISSKCIDIKKIENAFFLYGMRGEEDSDKVLNLLPFLQDLNDSNSIGLLPYSGHFPMIEEPEEFEEAINEFLD